ncbi:hypothetical protein [Baekduia soli]|uniref:hypothetical protein n=1 Tax=Baekduia soli TaxID=496014 RepID=UPI0016522C91|nr:hypothetical protein [Baekduia soli]
MLGDLRNHRGQAAVEWIGIVSLVVTLLALGAALAQAGQVGRQVTREMARALCRVGQGDCERDQDPCVVTAQRTHRGATLHVFFVRLGGGTTAVVEQRSDGTFAITHATDAALGLEAGAGVEGGVRLAGVDVALGASLSVAQSAGLEGGRTWIAPSAAVAARLVAALREDPGHLPEPDVTYRRGQVTSTAGGTAQVAGENVATATLTFGRTAGTRTDRRTGHRTVYVRSPWSGEAAVAGGVLGVSGAGGGEVFAVELDAHGRPLDLQVVATGAFARSQDLPSVVQPVAGRLAAGAADGRRFEVTAHLDLTDPADLAAARGLLAAMHDRFGPPAAASQALRRRIDEQGTIEARVLATRESSRGVTLSGALGARLGGSYVIQDASLALLAATSRGLDGQWLVRADCLPGA